MKPAILQAQFRVVTPVFCAGAEQNGPAEIRPFSLRGALRWWYRAVDRDFAAREARFFGAAGEKIGASPVMLRLGGWVTGSERYAQSLRPEKAQERGAAYLGYTLYLGKNDRKNDRRAVPPETRVAVELVQRRGDEEVRRAWAASLWLFGHLGGLGTRSRRGFGTMALERWSGWTACDELPLAHGATTPEDWKKRFAEGFATIRKWFSAAREAEHHHLGAELSDLWIWKRGFASWLEALDEAGSLFRDFRKRPEHHKPERLAAFGLPLQFRRSKLRVSLEKFDRAPSRLQFRVIKIGNRFHPLVWRAEGPLGPQKARLAFKGGSYPKNAPEEGAVKAFLEHVKPRCV